MQHHATATFQDRALADRAIDDLVSASLPHEQMRLVVRRPTGEEVVSVYPHRPLVPFAAVGAPLAGLAALVASWDADASLLAIAQNGIVTAFLGGLVAAYGALYFWRVRAAWPPAADDEVQILTLRGSAEQVRQAAQVLEATAPDVQIGDGTPSLLRDG
jgi:hypothetical protein